MSINTRHIARKRAKASLLISTILVAMPTVLYAEDRPNPLQVFLPSIPKEAAKVDVVDNDLAVHLLDVQVHEEEEAQVDVPPASAKKAPPAKASVSQAGQASQGVRSNGQVVIGARSEPVKSTARRTPIAQTLPRLPSRYSSSYRKPIRQVTPSVAFTGNNTAQPLPRLPIRSNPAYKAPVAAPSLQAARPVLTKQVAEAVSLPKISPATSVQTLASPAPTPAPAPAPIQFKPITKTLPQTLEAPTTIAQAAPPAIQAKSASLTSAPAPSTVAPEPVKQVSVRPEVVTLAPVRFPKSAPKSAPKPAPVVKRLPKLEPVAQQFASAAPVAAYRSTQQPKSFLSDFPIVRATQGQGLASLGASSRLASATPAQAFVPSALASAPQPAEPVVLSQVTKADLIAPSVQTGVEQKIPLPSLAESTSLDNNSDNNPDSHQVASITPATAPTTQEFAELTPAAGLANVDASASSSLSKESKRLISRIPSGIDSPKRARGGKVEITRENRNPVIFSDQGTTLDASHESVGMKIEVRRPVLDVNAELVNAYDAVVAGNNQLALATYERIVRAKPNNLNALYGYATLLHKTGDTANARKYYSRVLRKDADHPEALNNFLSLVAEEAPLEALSQLLKLQQKNPHFSPIPAQISYVYQRLNDYPRAISAMQDAYALAPDNLTYALNLAVLFDRYGAKPQAAEYYQQLIDAQLSGAQVPGNIETVQERLTFIRSNR